MRINTNISALNAHRQLGANQTNGAKSLERLSSGLRINRAGDDAAGLAISEKMRAQIRGLTQASRNAQDGISMIQTAEGNLNETHSILQRMRELADQAANDTNVGVDRNEIQKEINALTTEINRIGNTTEFNTQSLLKGDGKTNLAGTGIFENIKLTGGTDTKYTHATQSDAITEAAATGDTVTFTLNNVKLKVTFAAADANGQAAEAVYDVTGTSATVNLAESASADTTAAGLRKALEQMIEKNEVLRGNYVVSGESANVTYTATAEGVFAGAAGVIGTTAETGTIEFTTTSTGAAGETKPAEQATTELDFTGLDSAEKIKALLGRGMTINGQQIEFYDANAGSYRGDALGVNLSNAIETGTATAFVNAVVSQASAKLDGIILSEENTGKLTISADVGGTAGNSMEVKDGGIQSQFKATFQVGANSGQSMTIEINDMRSLALRVSGKESGAKVEAQNGIEASYVAATNVSNGTDNINVEYALDVSSHDKATNAISVINDAIETVSAERSKLGAYQNRLEHTIANLGTTSENLNAAESRIRDLDMAAEMMDFTKNNILNQAATAMLAQANMAPQTVLQLLG